MSWPCVNTLLIRIVFHPRYSRDVEGWVEGGFRWRRLLCVWVDGGQYWLREARSLRLLARHPLLLIHLEILRRSTSVEEVYVIARLSSLPILFPTVVRA